MFINQSFECLCMFCGRCLSHCFVPYLSLVLLWGIAIILDLLHFILKHVTLVAAVTQPPDHLDGLHKAVLEPLDVFSADSWELHVLIHPETVILWPLKGMYESLLTCQRGVEWRTDHWGKQQVLASCWSTAPCLLHTRRKYAWDYSEIPPLLVVQFQKPDSQEPIHLNGFEYVDCLFRIPPPVWSWGLPLGLEAWRQVCEYSQSGHTWARRPSWGCSALSSWHPPLFSSGISHF